ncbi:hypothetical protein CDL15_Pgr017733 [Punica granatum]|uniref:Uncharacterized protein n=1 Tax=Punica granatum TaxID=22663 RepID=A0A218WHK9_PUNGR|nr:hypothetical protein CDL15_Pgr017733 [Punica granatum]
MIKPNISDFFLGLALFYLQGIGQQMKGLVQWFDQIFRTIINQQLAGNGHEAVDGMCAHSNFVSSGHACARLNATRLGSVHLPGDARRTHVRRSRHYLFTTRRSRAGELPGLRVRGTPNC